MSRRHPINIWPAFSDLMTVLTIVGLFTALGLLQAPASLKAQNQALKAQNEELETTIDRLERLITELRQELLAIKTQRDRLVDRVRVLEAELLKARKGGEDPPPCLSLRGKPGKKFDPLYTIRIGDDGMDVQRAWPPELAQQIEGIPGVHRLAEAGRVGRSTFHRLARPVSTYAKDPQNTFGEKCIFYVRIEIATESKDRFGRYYSDITDHFFPSNPSAIKRFWKK